MEKINRQFEIDRPHGTCRLYRWCIGYKFRGMAGETGSLEGKKVLDLCCGSGMISEYYARAGAEIKGVDLSDEAIARARERKEKYGFTAEFASGDATELDEADMSYDIVSVHDGLHHLKDPFEAVSEMCRIARETVVIVEPARSPVTRLAVKLGISTDYEGDDYVYRFTAGELVFFLKKQGFRDVTVRRYMMYYPHEPGILFRILSIPVLFQLSTVFFYAVNLLFSSAAVR